MPALSTRSICQAGKYARTSLWVLFASPQQFQIKHSYSLVSLRLLNSGVYPEEFYIRSDHW